MKLEAAIADRRTGIAILDSSCWHHVSQATTRANLLGSARAADYIVWPSVINAVQLAIHPTADKRQSLLQAVNEVAGTLPLLPFPDELLTSSAEAYFRGETHIALSPTGAEWLHAEPETIRSEDTQPMAAALAALDAHFRGVLDEHRHIIQDFLRSNDLRDHWTHVADFLESQWMTERQLEGILAGETQRLGLSAPLTMGLIRACDTWRLHFEGFGAAMFRQAVQTQQEREVQATDWFQLVYLAGRNRRLFVTADRGQEQLARAVIAGRYPGARVMRWGEFEELLALPQSAT